ncbi:MAG: hypothetical protein Sapg2KO_52740 [Saprospiraceae bacterium]
MIESKFSKSKSCINSDRSETGILWTSRKSKFSGDWAKVICENSTNKLIKK